MGSSSQTLPQVLVQVNGEPPAIWAIVRPPPLQLPSIIWTRIRLQMPYFQGLPQTCRILLHRQLNAHSDIPLDLNPNF